MTLQNVEFQRRQASRVMRKLGANRCILMASGPDLTGEHMLQHVMVTSEAMDDQRRAQIFRDNLADALLWQIDDGERAEIVTAFGVVTLLRPKNARLVQPPK